MPPYFSSPHCPDVIEIRTRKGTPGGGCIRIVPGQCQLFEVKGAGLDVVGLFGTIARHQPVSSSAVHCTRPNGGRYGALLARVLESSEQLVLFLRFRNFPKKTHNVC